jgi:hypothetical protein
LIVKYINKGFIVQITHNEAHNLLNQLVDMGT